MRVYFQISFISDTPSQPLFQINPMKAESLLIVSLGWILGEEVCRIAVLKSKLLKEHLEVMLLTNLED